MTQDVDFTNLSQMQRTLFDDAMSEKLASLSTEQFGLLLRSYRKLSQEERRQVEKEASRRNDTTLHSLIEEKIVELEAIPAVQTMRTEAQKQKAQRLNEEISELNRQLASYERVAGTKR